MDPFTHFFSCLQVIFRHLSIFHIFSTSFGVFYLVISYVVWNLFDRINRFFFLKDC